jgi:hypothetical protein
MEPSVDYSAEQHALYYPCKRGQFFKNARPASDAAFCAEMAPLAYATLIAATSPLGFRSKKWASCTAESPICINRKCKVEFNPICLTIGLDRFRAATDYLEKYRWLLGKVPVREPADHAPINYAWAIAANQS